MSHVCRYLLMGEAPPGKNNPYLPVLAFIRKNLAKVLDADPQLKTKIELLVQQYNKTRTFGIGTVPKVACEKFGLLTEKERAFIKEMIGPSIFITFYFSQGKPDIEPTLLHVWYFSHPKKIETSGKIYTKNSKGAKKNWNK